MAGNNDVHHNPFIDGAQLQPTLAPGSANAGATSQPPRCLRDNECSQQQLVRLVGYRGPAVSAAASWDRLRREQAAQQGG